MGSRNRAGCGADSVGSRNGAGSGADSVGSRNGAGSGADSVGSRNRAGSGADSVGSRNGAGSGADWNGHRRLGRSQSWKASCPYRPHGWILQLAYQPRNPRVCCSFAGHHLRHTSHLSWGTCQKLPKFPKCQVVLPPHPPPAEGLIKGTVEEVLEGHLIVP